MYKSLAFLILLSFVGSSGDAKSVKGATPRKVRSVKVLDFDIEDLVRAEDDPQFADFVSERERQRQVDLQAVSLHKIERENFEKRSEKERLEFVAARDKKTEKFEWESYRHHLEAQRQWERNQQTAQRIFSEQREKDRLSQLQARQARLQKAFPQQRWPASLNEPKYPKPINSK